MICPKCGGKTTVEDNSFNPDTNELSRRRRCKACNHEFFTMEFEVECTEQFKKDWYDNHRTTVHTIKRRQQRNNTADCYQRCHPGMLRKESEEEE